MAKVRAIKAKTLWENIDQDLDQGGWSHRLETGRGVQSKPPAGTDEDTCRQRYGNGNGRCPEIKKNCSGPDAAQLADVIQRRGPADQGDKDQRHDNDLQQRKKGLSRQLEQTLNREIINRLGGGLRHHLQQPACQQADNDACGHAAEDLIGQAVLIFVLSILVCHGKRSDACY